jgi:hypothetical protein
MFQSANSSAGSERFAIVWLELFEQIYMPAG